MKLTPEKLSSAIEEYANQPENKRHITPQQVQWFYDPENVFMMFTLAITVPQETMDDIGDCIKDWFDAALSELALIAIHSPKDVKQQFEKSFEFILEYSQNESELNQSGVLFCLSELKRNQFHIRANLAELIAEKKPADGTNVTPFPSKLPSLKELLAEEQIQSGIQFIEIFETGLSVVPIEMLHIIFSEVSHQAWGIDALLLLTQYFEEPIALTSAQALDQSPSSGWKNLSYLQLINLCVRFNRHPSIKPYLKRWKKRALAHSKARETATIGDLYVSHVDGNDCASMMMEITFAGQQHQVNMMLDFKSGIRESMFYYTPEQPLIEFVKQLSDELIQFTPVSSDWLQQVLPWIFSVQQTKNTPLDLYSLYWLSQLPISWTQSEAFTLEQWGQKLAYEVDPKRQEQMRLGYANLGYDIQQPLMMSWLAPEEYLLKAKKPRDLLKLYYYANRDVFAERLAYSAAIENYKLPPEEPRLKNEYLDLAHTLYDPNLNRKRFGLFNALSELSFQAFVMDLNGLSDVIPPQGLVVKISLLEASPAVWRRVHISNQMTLNELHEVIQEVMGWEYEHLYSFHIGNTEIPEENYDQLCIGLFLQEEGQALTYRYDFGDNWEHEITVEKVLEKDVIKPKVAAGNGICPAEDSGGIWQWNYLLKLRKNKQLTEDEAERLEYVGLAPYQELEPFDKEKANRRLKELYENEWYRDQDLFD